MVAGNAGRGEQIGELAQMREVRGEVVQLVAAAVDRQDMEVVWCCGHGRSGQEQAQGGGDSDAHRSPQVYLAPAHASERIPSAILPQTIDPIGCAARS